MDGLNRRNFLRMAGAGALASGAGALAAAAGPGRALGTRRRPNVLFVFSDMQRANSLGCYGDPNARTPILDAFAKQGARLDAAMSNTPVCGPYRACLLSGLYAHNNGAMSNGVDFLPKVKCVAEIFAGAGYATGYCGKWHLDAPREGTENRRFGFPAKGLKYGFYKTERKTAVVTNVGLDFIEEKSKETAPWLLFVSWILPHSPYKAPKGYVEHFKDITIPPNVPAGAATAHAKKCLPDYYGMIESLDDEFGRLLDALEKAGVAEDTIVVYSSDHGDLIGAHGLTVKRWPYDESIRIPFLIRYPGAIPPETVIASPFGTPDVYPTLAGLAGVASANGLDGMDFSRLLKGEDSEPPRDYVYLEMAYAYVPWPGWRGFRTRRYMYARTKEKPWLLFDLPNDPWEMNNLVEDPAKRALVEEMDERLEKLMRDTGDSWDMKAHSGDLKNWVPGGAKQRAQSRLGSDWPGKALPRPARE